MIPEIWTAQVLAARLLTVKHERGRKNSMHKSYMKRSGNLYTCLGDDDVEQGAVLQLCQATLKAQVHLSHLFVVSFHR
jgi:hypothetical protein